MALRLFSRKNGSGYGQSAGTSVLPYEPSDTIELEEDPLQRQMQLERYGFIWTLIPFTVLTFGGIWFFHETPTTVLFIIMLGGFALLVSVLSYTIFSHRRARLQSLSDAGAGEAP